MRFLDGIEIDDNGCWVWQRFRDRHGYGKLWYDGRSHWVHRIAYAIFKGPIEAGLTINHECFNRGCCCNPDHLTPMTQSENSRRRQACMS